MKKLTAFVFALIALGFLALAYLKESLISEHKDQEQSPTIETPEQVISETSKEQERAPKNQAAQDQAQPQKIYSVEEGLKKLEKDFPAANANKTVPFTEPPKEHLVKDENGAEMIEVTYQDGSKVYLPNLPRYNALDGTMTPPLTSEDDD